MAVERALRQEAGFGCARCGHPYIEYHHIVPYAEEQHFRPQDMVALCGNCHPAVSRFGRDKQYKIKKSPYNAKRGLFRGALEYDKRDLIFKVGGNWFENVPVILRFRDTSIISCSIEDGQARVSLNFFDKDGTALLRVIKNEVVFRINDLWDFEYAHNLVVARYRPRDIALKIDFRRPEATIEGNIWLGGTRIKLGPNYSVMPQENNFIGCRIAGGNVGFQIGRPLVPCGPVGIQINGPLL